MFRQIEFNRFLDKIADALGTSAEEINDSELFEQAVYDMAKKQQALPDMDFKGKAHFGFTDDFDSNRIRIIYECSNVNTKALADFYHKYFPETQPHYTYGIQLAITFLPQQFIQKVLPTMKIMRTRPSCLTDNSLHYIESGKLLLTSALEVGFGNAVFISGADPLLGNWQTAQRMTYNNVERRWEMAIPAGAKISEFKFLTGSYDLGEKVNTKQLAYETGVNRTLIIFDPNNKPKQDKPTGYGMRC